MPDLLDLLDTKLAEHRARGEPEAVAFHIAQDIADKICQLMMDLPAFDRNDRGITIERERLGYRGMPVIPHELPDGWVLVLGDSPLTRTLFGHAGTDTNPARRAMREAWIIRHVIGPEHARRRR